MAELLRLLQVTGTGFASFMILFGSGIMILSGAGCAQNVTPDSGSAQMEQIRPYSANPHYLAWGDTPVYPLGPAGRHSWTMISRPGTAGFIGQMDRITEVIDSVGSPNVIGFMRNLPYDPMNHLHDGVAERVLQPWYMTEDGRYDLGMFDPEWESRFAEFLAAAYDRRIVLVMEIWDDWSITRGPGGEYDPGEGYGWNAHPFNPLNNINYDEDVLPAWTAVCDAPFYRTIPSRSHNEPVLELQKLYVDKVLELAADYPNIMINIANESRAHLDWSRFWASYISSRVPEGVLIGDMPSTNRLDGGGECEYAFSPLTLSSEPGYGFLDAAQGVSGHEFGSAQEQAIGGGERLRAYRQVMVEAGTVRPIVVSKDYTRAANGGDIVLWSRFAGGAAAARFHRPGLDHGPEVSDFQHESVYRLGVFIAGVPFWEMHPSPELVEQLPRLASANVLAAVEGDVVIQLLGGTEGSNLSVRLRPGEYTVRWVDPSQGTEIGRFDITARSEISPIYVPGNLEHRVLHIKAKPEE